MSGTSRWGSLLSGAVAGLESKLDTILADGDTQKAEEAARNAKLAVASKQTVSASALKSEERDGSRASSRNRKNDRLHDRLAKAVGKGADGSRSGRTSSEMPSRTASPTIQGARTESSVLEVQQESSIAGALAIDTREAENEASQNDSSTGTDKASEEAVDNLTTLGIPHASSTRPSQDHSTRTSLESTRPNDSTAPSSLPSLKRSPSFLESELSRVTEVQDEVNRNYQEELHAHLERIDALQAKLTYLAAQVSSAARASTSDATTSPAEKKLAEKDETIAQLMEEGQKLSKNEMKHLGTIKKLRARMQEEDKSSADLKRRLETVDRERLEQMERVAIAEEKERIAQERVKSLAKLYPQVEALTRERDAAAREIAGLKRQLADAEGRAEDAERRAQTEKVEEQMRVVAELNDELSNSRIEKRLIEDRAKAEMKQMKEEAARQLDAHQLAELELRSELQSLESKLELLRSRSEESNSNTSADAQTKLLRQVETLQTQYSLASENWQALESTLNSRLAALEKERDEIAKREADVRKKAREVNSKARRLEEELEAEKDMAGSVAADLAGQKAAMIKMQTRLSTAETALQEARTEMDRERKASERDLSARIEEEKTKWKHENQSSIPTTPMEGNHLLRAESPMSYFTQRKSSADLRNFQSRRSNAGSKTLTSDLPPLFTEHSYPSSRRTSTMAHHTTFPMRAPTDSATPSRHEYSNSIGQLNGSISRSASISMAPSLDAVDDQLDRESISSPHRTVNDLLSVSTAGAGPSVQLVERMSAAVRRLESEKAASKEDMVRVLGQRDEAREEVVNLMREIETIKGDKGKVEKLEEEVKEMKGRYDAALEMLGEKSEECEELKNDVLDLKNIYRELVESTLK